jgi:hypothetical protein
MNWTIIKYNVLVTIWTILVISCLYMWYRLGNICNKLYLCGKLDNTCGKLDNTMIN